MIKSIGKIILCATSLLYGMAHAGWSGYIEAETRLFDKAPVDARQHGDNLSLAIQTEYFRKWDDGHQRLIITPFIRVDEHDSERSHGDLRELLWLKSSDNWELRAGITKIFWGVTESRHLVDIINQDDLVENSDGEDKLGQPMLNFNLIHDWGVFGAYVLPYFRERTFPGLRGRLRTPLYVDTDQAVYESGNEEKHVDFALRWSHTINIWDIGISYFTGTGREPRLLPGTNSSGQSVLIPYYDQIKQIGIDLQATQDSWLWKLEAIHRSGQGKDFYAAVGGAEYTLYGILGSTYDLGLIAEYLYDDRDAQAPQSLAQDDIMVGMRLNLNDAQASEALLGVITDRDSHARVLSLELNRRFGNHWKLGLESRYFNADNAADPIAGFEHDRYLQLSAAYHF